MILATAAASAIFGGRHSDATPHGRLLGTLQAMAEAQESHYREAGRFTWRLDRLEVDAPEGIGLTVTQSSDTQWEARVRSEEHGLSCVQAGRWDGGRPVRDQPVCYTEAS